MSDQNKPHIVDAEFTVVGYLPSPASVILRRVWFYLMAADPAFRLRYQPWNAMRTMRVSVRMSFAACVLMAWGPFALIALWRLLLPS